MTTSRFEGTFDLADYEHDQTTVVLHEMLLMIARWPQDRRDEAHATLGGLAILCATSSQHPDHRATAELLTLMRRLIRATEGEYPEDSGNGN